MLTYEAERARRLAEEQLALGKEARVDAGTPLIEPSYCLNTASIEP
jgi:hypothetical protein